LLDHLIDLSIVEMVGTKDEVVGPAALGGGSSVPLSVVKAELFKALANPARIRVLEVLAEGEQSVGELAPLVGLELSHLSQQLGVLRRAGLVTTRKEGSSVFYALKDLMVAELLAVTKRLLVATLSETRDLLADLAVVEPTL
jgi:ArsR family transcriptional regulator